MGVGWGEGRRVRGEEGEGEEGEGGGGLSLEGILCFKNVSGKMIKQHFFTCLMGEC